MQWKKKGCRVARGEQQLFHGYALEQVDIDIMGLWKRHRRGTNTYWL